jgi:ribonuclease HI
MKNLMKQSTLDAFIRKTECKDVLPKTVAVKEPFKEPFKEPVKEPAKESSSQLVVFTDGACANNGKRFAKASYACVWPDYPQYNTGLPLPPNETQTNNRGEYRALLHALIQADECIDPKKHKSLLVYTDSKLMIDSFTKWIRGWKQKGWKKADGSPVANIDLLTLIDDKMKRRCVVFKHVRAHTGRQDWESIHNDMVDRLARGAVSEIR